MEMLPTPRPWLVQTCGIVITVLGAVLALAQGISNASTFPYFDQSTLTALGLHLSVIAIGTAIYAAGGAYGAFRAQHKQLLYTEEQVEILRQTPWINIHWADNGEDEDDDDDCMTLALHPKPKGDHHIYLTFTLNNRGKRLAGMYQIELKVPRILEEHGFVSQYQPHTDMYSQEVLLTYVARDQDSVYYFWNVLKDRGFILFPNATATPIRPQQVDCHPDGPVTSIWNTPGVWDVEHLLEVKIVGDWGTQPTKAFRLKLTRPKSWLTSGRTLTIS